MMKFPYLYVVFSLNILHVTMQITVSPRMVNLERCIQTNADVFQAAGSNFIQCQQESYRDFDFSKFKSDSLDSLKELLKLICRNADVQKCFRNFKNEMRVCLDDELEKATDNMLAVVKAGRDYVCKDEGAKFLDLLSMPETEQCVANLFRGQFIIRNECTEPLVKTQEEMVYGFNEQNCKALDFVRNCFVGDLRKQCPDDKGFVDYASDLYSALLKATDCKEFLHFTVDDQTTISTVSGTTKSMSFSISVCAVTAMTIMSQYH